MPCRTRLKIPESFAGADPKSSEVSKKFETISVIAFMLGSHGAPTQLQPQCVLLEL